MHPLEHSAYMIAEEQLKLHSLLSLHLGNTGLVYKGFQSLNTQEI